MGYIVEIEQRQIDALDLAAKRRQTSRNALVREALDEFLDRTADDHNDEALTHDDRETRLAEREAILKKTFGAWGNRAVDGLAYTNALRDEW